MNKRFNERFADGFFAVAVFGSMIAALILISIAACSCEQDDLHWTPNTNPLIEPELAAVYAECLDNELCDSPCGMRWSVNADGEAWFVCCDDYCKFECVSGAPCEADRVCWRADWVEEECNGGE